MIKPFDIINLPYPMFPVTEGEKAILRKCEVNYAADTTGSAGLCGNVLDSCNLATEGYNLVNKISNSLCSALFLESYLETDFYIGYSLKNRMLRRVWITKLLNQDVL